MDLISFTAVLVFWCDVTHVFRSEWTRL